MTLETVLKNNSYVTLKYLNSLDKSLFSQKANTQFYTKMSWLKQQMFLWAFLLIFTLVKEQETVDSSAVLSQTI